MKIAQFVRTALVGIWLWGICGTVGAVIINEGGDGFGSIGSESNFIALEGDNIFNGSILGLLTPTPPPPDEDDAISVGGPGLEFISGSLEVLTIGFVLDFGGDIPAVAITGGGGATSLTDPEIAALNQGTGLLEISSNAGCTNCAFNQKPIEYVITLTTQAINTEVPEPATFALLFLGIAGFGFRRCRTV